MMVFVIVVIALIQSVFLVFGLYLLFLTLAGLKYRSRAAEASQPRTRLAILIPAHNEEGQLPALLESLLATGYPRGLFQLFVVADNCTDGTADVACWYGARTFERVDTINRGKGHALRWLMEQVRQTGDQHDAYLFIDADCQVSPNFLHAMDSRFQAGASVIQAYYTVADPFRTNVSALRFTALVLKHYVRPLGRARLKLSCGLFGTGMGFKKHVLDGHAWTAYTLAEDIEYYMQLTEQGVVVAFAPEAVVSSQMPTSLGGSRSQNLRWEKGRLQMLRTHGPRLFWKGVLNQDFKKVDAVLEQAIPPLSLAVMAVVVMLLATWFTGETWLFSLSVVTVIAYLGHAIIGLNLAGVPLRTYWSLIHVPRYVLWKLLVYLQALLPGRQEWTRTQR